jgi:hypothetical protein
MFIRDVSMMCAPHFWQGIPLFSSKRNTLAYEVKENGEYFPMYSELFLLTLAGSPVWVPEKQILVK